MTTLQRYQQELVIYLRGLLKSNTSTTSLRAQVDLWLRSHPLPSALSESIIAASLAESTWARERTLPEAERAAVASVLSIGNTRLATIGGKVYNRILGEIERSIVEGVNGKEIEARVARSVQRAAPHVQTIVRTGQAAFDRLETVTEAQRLGYTHLRMVGPPPDRIFCRKHYHKEYSIEEIKQMDNGQGLPVLTHVGGFNCVHDWEPVHL